MAKYLGKISAVVTANTADFTNKLNSAAGTVRKFAGEVQGNITGAMNDADRAFKSVLTPLQKLEASLKAASSMKLSFKGVDGAIGDIEALKARMQTLKGTSVKLVLDASGFKSIESYRNALDGLSKRGAKILVDVGGLDKAKAIQATLATSGNKTIKVGLSRINRDELDSVIAAIDKLGEEKIKTVIDVIGQADLDAAVLKTQQLFSASELLAKPLGRGVAEFDRLSYAVQAGFIPALSLTQNAVLGLEKDIKDGATVGVNEFDRLEKQVIKTVKSIQRLSEVAELVGKIKTGQEFAFTDPKMNQRLTTAAAQGDQAAALPPDTLASNKNITPLIAQASELAQKIAETDAQIKKFGEGSFFASKLPQQLAVLGSALDSVNKKVATELRIQLDATTATSTANALNDKIASLYATLTGPTDPFGRMAASARGAKEAVDALGDGAEKTALQSRLGLSEQNLQRMSVPGTVNTPESMAAVGTELEKIKALAAMRYTVQLDTAAAMADVTALNAKIGSIAATLTDTTNPYEKLAESARAAKTAVDALDDGAEKTALQGQLGLSQQRLQRMSVPGTVNSATSLGDVERELDSIRSQARERMTVQVDTAEATARLNAMNERLGSIASTLSAPTDLFDRMATSANAARTAVDALGDSAGKTALQGELAVEQQNLQRMAVPGTVNTPQAMAAVERQLDGIAARARSGLVVQLDDAAALADVDELKRRLLSVADTIGEPSRIFDRMTLAINGSVSAVAALNDGVAKTALEGRLAGLRRNIEGAATVSGPLPPDLMSDAERQARAVTADAGLEAARQAPPPPTPPAPLGTPVGDVGSADDLANQMALLQTSTNAAKAQLNQLPISIRTKFIPAIQAAEAEFTRLTASAGASAEEIENAGNKVAGLKTAMSTAASIKMSGAIINDSQIAASMGRLGGAQQILLDIGETAGGPVAGAYDKLARHMEGAITAGTIGTPAVTKELKELEDGLVTATGASGKMSEAEARRKLKKGGDIGRGGMDRFSMAANQAAFALDDFFSSVGGWDQKLRAVSNNVTQLGFVLGGTTGLFVGLGAVLAGQVAVGILKWINSGRTAEDQTKALNEALSRQKSLVDDLAQSFRGLADAIGRGMFSEGASIGIDFGKDVGEVKRKQKELRDSRRADIDPNVQKERANQARDQRLLDKSESVPERIVLAKQIRESQKREAEAAAAATSKSAVQAEAESKDAVRRSVERRLNASLKPLEGQEGAAEFVAAERLKNKQTAEAAANAMPANDLVATREALVNEAKALAEQRAAGGGGKELDASIVELEKLIKDLEDPIHEAIDKLAIEIVTASNDAAQRIAAAQKDVASAIERGVPGAIAFQRELDANAAALASANDTLAQASKITDDKERQRAVDAAQGDVKRAEKGLEDTESKRRSVRLGMTQGGDRTKDALSSLQGDRELMNSRAVSIGRDRVDKENAAREKAGVSSGKLARAKKELEDAQTANNLAAQNFNANKTPANDAAFEAANQAFLDAQKKLAEALAASKVDDEAVKIAQAESEAAAALMEFTRALEDSVSRIRKIASDALSTSTQMADNAQRNFTEQKPVAQGGMPPNELRARRDKAEADLINDQKKTADAQAGITKARELAQLNDPKVQAANAKLEAIEQERKADQAKMLELRARPGGVTSAEEQAAIERENDRNRRQAAAQQEQAQAMAGNAGVQSAQATADKAAQEIDQRRQNQEAAAAGRELALTPREKQAEEMATGVNQLKQKGLETADNAERARIINNGAKNLRAQAAPMIEAMNNSRLSAILEGNNGPSRQALKVSDVNTMEGQSEMNRLLRGDDAAKNVDLEELRKQTQALTDLNKMVGEAKQALGVA